MRFFPGSSFSTMQCSFCHKPNHQVAKLISNHPKDLRRAYICDACIAVCNSILEKSDANIAEQGAHPTPGRTAGRLDSGQNRWWRFWRRISQPVFQASPIAAASPAEGVAL